MGVSRKLKTQFILDFGSGNTCRNDIEIVKKMLHSLCDVDEMHHEVIIKWQLFKEALPNIPLDHKVFDFAYKFAERLGYKTTASVFDRESLAFLMQYDVPFVKIACRPDLYELAQYCTVPVYVSTANSSTVSGAKMMYCVSKYPALLEDYEQAFTKEELSECVSDHTVGWDLYNKYNCKTIEKHFVHERRADNPDAGMFAVTPFQLCEVL
jgi:sialic acid synthase SpsE